MGLLEVLVGVQVHQMKNVLLNFELPVTVYEMDVVFVKEADVVHQVLDVVLPVLHGDWEILYAIHRMPEPVVADNVKVMVNEKCYEAATDDVGEG